MYLPAWLVRRLGSRRPEHVLYTFRLLVPIVGAFVVSRRCRLGGLRGVELNREPLDSGLVLLVLVDESVDFILERAQDGGVGVLLRSVLCGTICSCWSIDAAVNSL